MKRHLPSFRSLFLSMILLSISVHGDNMLDNSGFEDPSQWSTGGIIERGFYGFGSVMHAAWAARDGDYGVAFAGWEPNGYGGIFQSVALAGTNCIGNFTLSADFFTESDFVMADELLDLRIEFRDASDVRIQAFETNIYPELDAARGGWVRKSFQVHNTNQNAARVWAVLCSGTYGSPSGGGPCALMCDNVEMSFGNDELLVFALGASSDWFSLYTNTLVVSYGGSLRDEDITVSLVSDPDSLVEMPDSVTIPAGTNAVQVPVFCNSTGSVMVTASDGTGVPGVRTFNIGSAYLVLTGPSELPANHSGLWTVRRFGPDLSEITVTITDTLQSGYEQAVIMGEGVDEVEFLRETSVAGTAVLRAACYPYDQGGCMLEVKPWVLASAEEQEIPCGRTMAFPLSRNGPLESNLVVRVLGGSNAFVHLPETVIIPAGTASVTYVVQGLLPGQSTYQLEADGYETQTCNLIIGINQLINGGFEDADDFSHTEDTSWHAFGDLGVASWNAARGTNSLAFYTWNAGSYGGAYQLIPLESNDVGCSYTFGADLQAERFFSSDSESLSLVIDFRDASGGCIDKIETNIYSAVLEHKGHWGHHQVTAVNQQTNAVQALFCIVCSDYRPRHDRLLALNADNASVIRRDPSEVSLHLDCASCHLGLTNRWSLTLSESREQDTIVELVTTSASNVFLPDSVVITGGQTSVVVHAVVAEEGVVGITAYAEGIQPDIQSVIIERSHLTAHASAAFVGVTTLVEVVSSTVLPFDLEVALENSSELILAAPSSVTLAAGDTTVIVPVYGLEAGKALLTMEAANFSTTNVAVDVTVMELTMGLPDEIYAGTATEFLITRNGPNIDEALEVSFASHGMAHVPAPSSVTFAAGCRTTNVSLVVVGLGDFGVVATAPLYPDSLLTGVALASRLELEQLTPLRMGFDALWRVTRYGSVSNAYYVNISDSPDLVSLPDPVFLAAGCSSTTFVLRAKGLGDVDISASIAGYVSDVVCTETTGNLLIDPGFERASNWGVDWRSYGEVGRHEWCREEGGYGVCFYSWMTGEYGGVFQDVALPGSSVECLYSFSIDVRPDVDYLCSADSVILLTEFWDGDVKCTGSTNSIFTNGTPVLGQWERYNVMTVVTNAGVDRVTAVFCGDTYASTGGFCAVMFDQAELTRHSLTGSVLIIHGSSSELAGSTNLWTVTRTGSVDSDLTVRLSSTDETIVFMAQEVVIPAGHRTAVFPVMVASVLGPSSQDRLFGSIPDETPVGSEEVVVTASASGYPSVQHSVLAEPDTLIFAGADEVSVGGVALLTVSRGTPAASSLTVTMDADSPSVTAPTVVTILAGKQSASLEIQGISAGDANITASAAGYDEACFSMSVIDFDPNALCSAQGEENELRWSAHAGITYCVEEAFSLTGTWYQAYTTVASANSELSWVDPYSEGVQAKYYRITAQTSNDMSGGSVYIPSF